MATLQRALGGDRERRRTRAVKPERPDSDDRSPALDSTVTRPRHNLTNGQLVIWMGQHLAPEIPCYENAITLLVEGRVDPARAAEAFQALIDGSDALRSVIDEVDGVPVRRVLPELAYPLPVLRLDPGEDPDAALAAWARERVAQPPRMRERLFDAALIELGPHRFAWFLSTHHVMHDGRSCQLIYERLAELYHRAAAGTLQAAPPWPGYDDYLAIEQESRTSDAWRRNDMYWRGVLEVAYEPMELYGVASGQRNHEERWVSIDLGPGRTEALRARARERGFRSLNADLSLLGIFSTLLFSYLYRVSGTRTLSIGLPFHNRDRTSEATIGLVQQVYPLVVEVAAGETFATLMSKAMRALLDVLAHSGQGGGNSTHRGANDIMLNYLPLSFPDFDGFRTRTRFVPKAAADGSHCLMVQVHDLDATGSFGVDLIFNAGVFEADRKAAATAHFLNVVDRFLSDPHADLDDIDLLTPEERRHLVVELNATDRVWPRGHTIDELVAAQAARSPDGVAAEWGPETLTYAALDSKANRLAHHLQSLGAGPGVVVGVYAPRCLDLAVAVLAIAKAGAGYLPLDTAYPAERLNFILDDSRASVLLTQAAMARLDGASVATVVDLDDLDPLLADYPADPPVNAAGPDDLAYVIYTSGSTGRPKGAAVPQRALVNVIWWQANVASSLSRPRTLQFSPLSFDVSLQEIFATWCAGGTLVLPTGDVRRDPEALARLLVEAEVEVLYSIFTPLQQLAETVDRLGLVPERLREVFSCGEPVTITPAIQRLFERLPRCRFQIQYGSSEDLIVTSHTLSGPPSTWPRVPPIGRPIANTRVYVLDPRLEPVPVGVPGEICVGGAQVSLGYLHRSELTAARFVPDPFSDVPGALLFRQGDLARLAPGGELQFLGRMDSQIKLRGFRIEPGEVEAALCDHPLVDEAAVVLREDEPGDKRLVAYIVPSPGWTAKRLPEVHRSLLGRLAPYMVPAAFVTLERLPKTPSGKLDRRSLPRPDPDRPELETAYAAPESKLEQQLADIWQEALGIDRVGVTDDFFALGGDSLLALQVVHDVEGLVDRRLPQATIFQAPTIAGLAALLRDTGWMASRSLIPVRTTGSKAPLYFVSGPTGRQLADHIDQDRPFYALHPRGLAGHDADTSVEDMAANYIEEIRAVQPHGPYLLGGGACLGGQVAFEMARQLVAEGEAVAKTVIVESYAPGIIGFQPRGWRARFRRRVVRLVVSFEASRPGGGLVSLLSRARYGDKVVAKPVLDEPLLLTIKNVRRSNLRALLTYTPPTYPGAVAVFSGDRDREDIPSLGWDRFAEGGVEMHDIPGYHQSVLHEPHVATLAGKLNACLDSTGL